MPNNLDPYSFGFLTVDIARLIRAEFDRRMAGSGLGVTAAEARALFHIARCDGARQTAIAERMGVEAMTVSGLIDRLEARGLVVRETDPDDRRAKRVLLTDAAQEVLDATRMLSDGVRDEARGDVSIAEWDRMLGVLRKTHANLLALRGCTERESSTA